MTLYGIAEAAYGTDTKVSGSSTVTDNKKTTGLAEGTGNGRIGFMGTEDLGGGLKANFVAESVMSFVNGTSADKEVQTTTDQKGQVGFFGKTRQTLIGLQHAGYGALNVGYKKGTEQDFNDTWNYGFREGYAGNSAHTAYRIGRAKGIYYTAPKFANIDVNVQYTTGAQANEDAATAATSDIDAKLIGISAVYTNGPVKAGLNNTSGNVDLGTSVALTSFTDTAAASSLLVANKQNDYKATNWGAEYDFGMLKAVAQAGKRKGGDTSLATGLRSVKYTQWGVNMPIGKIELIAEVNSYKFEDPATAANEFKTKGNQFGAKYNFSKRTIGYAFLGKEKKDFVTTDNNDSTTKAAIIGMMHKF